MVACCDYHPESCYNLNRENNFTNLNHLIKTFVIFTNSNPPDGFFSTQLSKFWQVFDNQKFHCTGMKIMHWYCYIVWSYSSQYCFDFLIEALCSLCWKINTSTPGIHFFEVLTWLFALPSPFLQDRDVWDFMSLSSFQTSSFHPSAFMWKLRWYCEG